MNGTGMNGLNDQAIAMELLISAKTGVRNCAYAITEAATPEVRNALNQQLQQAINFHENVSAYVMQKGYYEPYNLNQQIQIDQQLAQQATQQSQQTQQQYQ